jgi:transposase-like protein
MLDDLTGRGLARPDLVIVDGGKGLEAALASLWDDMPVQRCTVHKERNLLAHASQHLHDEIKADFNDMVHDESKEGTEHVAADGGIACWVRPPLRTLDQIEVTVRVDQLRADEHI